ncbi:MAG: hypothetical protein GY756_06780 [bacterium]|nr:hypothetical protein [bacterium]
MYTITYYKYKVEKVPDSNRKTIKLWSILITKNINYVVTYISDNHNTSDAVIQKDMPYTV